MRIERDENEAAARPQLVISGQQILCGVPRRVLAYVTAPSGYAPFWNTFSAPLLPPLNSTGLLLLCVLVPFP